VTKTQKTLPYREGTWFAVPLRDHGFAAGIAARMDGRGGVFGYFFGPRWETIPPIQKLTHLRPEDALLRARFGDLGLIDNKWPVVGVMPVWNRNVWSLPPFINVDKTTNRAVKVTLSNDDLAFVGQESCDPTLAKELPQDADYGYGAVEIVLTKLLSE